MARRRAEARLLPDRDQLIDAGFLLAGSLTALIGLGSTYPGVSYLVVGVVGLLLAGVLGHLGAAARLPSVASVAGVIVIFFVLGPPLCLRGAGHPVPGPAAWGVLTDQVIFGWKDLLTTLPPVDGSGPLLVLPFLLGLVTGLLGTLLARISGGPQWLRVVLPLIAPLLLLGVVILIGLHTPYRLLISGGLSAAFALGWLILRAHRGQTQVVGGTGRLGRMLIGATIVALAAAAANPVATWATGGSDSGRVVFRSYVEPPFDIGQYPSPLAGFRRFVEHPKNPPPNNLFATELFTVEGVRAGTRVRIAVLDNYDGVVWGASNGAVPDTDVDSYARVGPRLDNPSPGGEVDARITLGEGYAGVWLPLIGSLQDISFDTNPRAYESEFRYNLAAQAGVVPPGLVPGDRYTFLAKKPPTEVDAEDSPSPELGSAALNQPWLSEAADKLSDPGASPMQRVFAIADRLYADGKYSDGLVGREIIYTPGHYIDRLDRGFLNDVQIVGNAEQYASAMALLANAVGVPARVVLGAVVPEGGVVEGGDVTAWVELRIADGSWRVLPTERFMSRQKPAQEQTKDKQQQSGVVIPPPAQVPPPSTLGEQTDSEITPRKVKADRDGDDGSAAPGWLGALLLYAGVPLLVIAALLGSIVALKALRRRRRRSTGPASARIVGGWRELVDHAHDLGMRVPTRGMTRSEQAVLLPAGSAAALARRADVSVFAARAPEDDAVTGFWDGVAAERRTLSASVGRRRRWLAAVDPRSLLRRR